MAIFNKLFATMVASSVFFTCNQQVEAHVTAYPNTRDSSAPAGVTNFVVPHSCSNSAGGVTTYYPTIAIEAQISENITTALPQDVAGWNLALIETPVITSTGATAVRRTFNWTIADPSVGLITKKLGLLSFYWSVPTSLRGSDKTFVFPVTQYCQNGYVNYWTLQPGQTSSSTAETPGTAEAAPTVKYTATPAAVLAAQSVFATSVSSNSSSGWNQSDTLSVIAIILSAISVLVFAAYGLKRFLDRDVNSPLDKSTNYEEKKLTTV